MRALTATGQPSKGEPRVSEPTIPSVNSLDRLVGSTWVVTPSERFCSDRETITRGEWLRRHAITYPSAVAS